MYNHRKDHHWYDHGCQMSLEIPLLGDHSEISQIPTHMRVISPGHRVHMILISQVAHLLINANTSPSGWIITL